MINPSCNPKDWTIKRLSRQPKLWEGSKIKVDMKNESIIDRIFDAIKVLKIKVRGYEPNHGGKVGR